MYAGGPCARLLYLKIPGPADIGEVNFLGLLEIPKSCLHLTRREFNDTDGLYWCSSEKLPCLHSEK